MTEHHYHDNWFSMANAGFLVGLPIVAVVVGGIVGACLILRPTSTAAPMPAPAPVATMTLPSYPLAPEPAPPRPDTKIFEEFAATLTTVQRTPESGSTEGKLREGGARSAEVPLSQPQSVPMPSHHRRSTRVAPDGRMNRGASEPAETARLNAIQIAKGDAPP